jgi:hypothetical protein
MKFNSDYSWNKFMPKRSSHMANQTDSDHTHTHTIYIYIPESTSWKQGLAKYFGLWNLVTYLRMLGK